MTLLKISQIGPGNFVGEEEILTKPEPVTIDRLLEVAKAVGVHVPEDVKVELKDDVSMDELHGPTKNATWAGGSFSSWKIYRWNDLYEKDVILVRCRNSFGLERTVGLLAHELHEVQEIRKLFMQNDEILGERLLKLVETSEIMGGGGYIHNEAQIVELNTRQKVIEYLNPENQREDRK